MPMSESWRCSAIRRPNVMHPDASALSSSRRTTDRGGKHLFGVAHHRRGSGPACRSSGDDVEPQAAPRLRNSRVSDAARTSSIASPDLSRRRPAIVAIPIIRPGVH